MGQSGGGRPTNVILSAARIQITVKARNCALVLPRIWAARLDAEQRKKPVVRMLHAHVWVHLGTMLTHDPMKLAVVSDSLPNLIARATHEDAISQRQVAI